MIPVSLQLQNFLSYGENVPPLDFTEFDVACLSGNNGHGKSAMLDAMTWAIWGEARKAAGEKSPADGLLRIGSTEMQVEFVFDLEGDRYRVLRKYQRKRRGKITSLDFQVFDETGHAYKSLTEKTARATQEKINAILRMNYDTFINSAFILQGRVDEFTKKTPHKRKEVFAEILDLSRYDKLAELAKDFHRNAKNQCNVLEEQLHAIDQELKHKTEYEQTLAELDRYVADTDQKIQTHEAHRQSLEKHHTELQGKQTQLDESKRQQKQLGLEIERLGKRKEQQQRQIAEVQTILERKQEILEQYDRYISFQKQETVYEEKRRQTGTYQAQKGELETKIQDSRHGLEKELEKHRAAQVQIQKTLNDVQQLLQKEKEIEQGYQQLQAARIQDDSLEEIRNQVEVLERSLRVVEKGLEQQKGQLIVELQSYQRHIAELHLLAEQQPAREKDVRKYKDAVAQLDVLEQSREQSKESGTNYRSQLESLKERQKHLQESVQELEEKLDLLKRSDTPQCPLCSSSLDEHKKEELEEHFRNEIRNVHDEQQRIAKDIREHENRLEELRKQYKQIEQQLKKQQRSREHLIQAENALQESRKAGSHRDELRKHVSVLQTRIEEKAFAQDEHAQLEELQNQIRTLAYDSKTHQTLKHRLKNLQQFEREFTKLEGARERQREATASLPAIEREIARIRAMVAQQDYAHAEREQLRKILTNIEAIGYDEQAHTQLRKELQHLRDAPAQQAELEQAGKSLGVLQQTLHELTGEQEQKTESFADIAHKIHLLEDELKELPIVQRELAEVKMQLHTLRHDRDDLLQKRGTYQNKYEHCQQLEIESHQKHGEKKRAQKDYEIYGHLIRIFGKDGMQAYLIENALPEIEDEANNILAKLTDNRTHVSIESVKDLQSGGTKETLDIKISDELGTRSYELYSGGEAFRVDFAIRIALSKLLANRAGTKLKTLVIDEGFGTQDSRGLDQLVEAIKTISTDFEKILVITHLESLKDAFPVRIEVVKQPDIGSQYQIVR